MGLRVRGATLLLLLLPLLVSLALRLYPTLMSGLPFSTDAWPLIRNAEAVVEHTPVGLEEEVFDGYNNYWPASLIFGAVLSEVAGLSVMAAMAVGLPMCAALSVLLFYVLTYRLFRGHRLAFFASLLLAVAFPYALSAAGATKESYASPIYVLLFLIFLSLRGWRSIMLFAVSSVALVMAHHLTSLVALLALVSIVLSTNLRRFLSGLDFDWLRSAFAAMLAASIILYFMVFASRGFKVAVALSDIITAASYQAVMFAAALYFTRPSNSKRGADAWVGVKYLVAAAVPAVVLALATSRFIAPGAPVLPMRYFVYGLPFILSAPLLVSGFRGLKGAGCGDEVGFKLVFWLASIIGLGSYALFGDTPLGLTLVYRVMSFLWLPLAILCGYGVYKLFSAKRGLAAGLIAVLVVFSCVSNCAAVVVGERYLGYFWFYRAQEFRAGDWVSSLCDNSTVAGDVKYAYLLKHYFGLSYDELQGLRYLSGRASEEPDILLSYDLMRRNGYVVYGGYSVDLPSDWVRRAYDLNLVYSNGVVDVHAGG